MLDKAQRQVDSQQYIFAYLIRSSSDFPADFPIPQAEALQTGLFLPRDDPDWFGRSGYPARILLLFPGMLAIIAHPAAKESEKWVRLDELVFVESGHILLQGWLQLVEKSAEIGLPFNTRSRHVIDAFLQSFRRECLRRPAGDHSKEPCWFGQHLSLKFQNAQSGELNGGEQVILRFFNPAVKRTSRRVLFRCETWVPGDLMAITDRRALWITDNCASQYEPYGTIARWAPLDRIRGLSCENSDDASGIRFVFAAEREWRILVPRETSGEAARFVAETKRLLWNAGFSPGISDYSHE